MEFRGRKRDRLDDDYSGNGGSKKSRDEMESITTGVGSKSKACTKFYSTSGCQYGESCHFSHYVPGYSAQTQLASKGSAQGARNAPLNDGPAPAPSVKSKLCSRFESPEGCKFGDKCHFAHGDVELGMSIIPNYREQRSAGGRFSGRVEPSPPSFGTSATAKISIDASLVGAVIGKNGVNSKQICRVTGVKLSIRDHETDPNQRNIELEGSFDSIKLASDMVREVIANIKGGSFGRGGPTRSQLKSKMCDNFPKGSCKFGDRCHFAHSESELQKM